MNRQELNALASAAFALETVAHLRGLEKQLLPTAEVLRGIAERYMPSCRSCGSSQRFVKRVQLGGFECRHSWHAAHEERLTDDPANRNAEMSRLGELVSARRIAMQAMQEGRTPPANSGEVPTGDVPSYTELAELVRWLCVDHEDSIMPITVIARVHDMHRRLEEGK